MALRLERNNMKILLLTITVLVFWLTLYAIGTYKKRPYSYFVTYTWFSDTNNGFGNDFIIRTEKIKTCKDVKFITTWMNDTYAKEVDKYGDNAAFVMLSYKRVKNNRNLQVRSE